MFRSKSLVDDEILALINTGDDSEIEELGEEDLDELDAYKGKTYPI